MFYPSVPNAQNNENSILATATDGSLPCTVMDVKVPVSCSLGPSDVITSSSSLSLSLKSTPFRISDLLSSCGSRSSVGDAGEGPSSTHALTNFIKFTNPVINGKCGPAASTAKMEIAEDIGE